MNPETDKFATALDISLNQLYSTFVDAVERTSGVQKVAAQGAVHAMKKAAEVVNATKERIVADKDAKKKQSEAAREAEQQKQVQNPEVAPEQVAPEMDQVDQGKKTAIESIIDKKLWPIIEDLTVSSGDVDDKTSLNADRGDLIDSDGNPVITNNHADCLKALVSAFVYNGNQEELKKAETTAVSNIKSGIRV